VELKNGSTRVGEIHAGSGYFSQSAAACFFGWSDDNPPAKIRIAWPSGTSTEQVVPPGSTVLILSPHEP
jgi:hypothetical protein